MSDAAVEGASKRTEVKTARHRTGWIEAGPKQGPLMISYTRPKSVAVYATPARRAIQNPSPPIGPALVTLLGGCRATYSRW